MKYINEKLKRLKGHTDDVTCLALISNNQLASGSVDNTIKIWDLTERKELYSLNGHTATRHSTNLIKIFVKDDLNVC